MPKRRGPVGITSRARLTVRPPDRDILGPTVDAITRTQADLDLARITRNQINRGAGRAMRAVSPAPRVRLPRGMRGVESRATSGRARARGR